MPVSTGGCGRGGGVVLGSGKGRAWSGTGHNHTGRGGRTQRACHHGAWAWARGGGRQGQDGLGAASCGDQRVWKGPLSQGATPSACWVHRAGPAGLEAGSEQGRWGVSGWSTQRTQPLGGPRPPMALPWATAGHTHQRQQRLLGRPGSNPQATEQRPAGRLPARGPLPV